MKCPHDCDGELVIQTVTEFLINDDLSLRMESLDLTGEPHIYCNQCGKDLPEHVISNIRIIVLDFDGLEERIKEAVNGPS